MVWVMVLVRGLVRGGSFFKVTKVTKAKQAKQAKKNKVRQNPEVDENCAVHQSATPLPQDDDMV